MPYIKDTNGRRKELREGAIALGAGELNYQIFSYVKSCDGVTIEEEIVEKYVENFLGKKRNYQKYNDMTGCLICCYNEIRRRLGYCLRLIKCILNSYDKEIADYEDLKIKENGDV